ncbi:MAG TPA: peptidoglycan editing factor PgeF [Pyrinomonadaceae bacterium]|nr:peptidoglycan editing factor PgeF [Pyrinomonadaceae bacterium]
MSMPMDTIMEQAVNSQSDVSNHSTYKNQKPKTEDQILTETGFYWREKNGIKALICSLLEEKGFTNAFSTRLGGVSAFPESDLNLAGFDEDSAENIAENRRRFLSLFDEDHLLTTVWQVHGDHVKAVKTLDDAANTEERFDALVSNLSGILVGVKTADCVPVLLGDPVSGAFAAVHAGWRGTVESIVVKAVEKMKENFGTNPEDLVCAIGPAATCRSYEIGQDVIDAFEKNFSTSGKYFTRTREGHALVDLHLANKDQLMAAGVREKNIFTAPFCTMERTDLFFSYRIEKKKYGKTGRLLSVIGKNGRRE